MTTFADRATLATALADFFRKHPDIPSGAIAELAEAVGTAATAVANERDAQDYELYAADWRNAAEMLKHILEVAAADQSDFEAEGSL